MHFSWSIWVFGVCGLVFMQGLLGTVGCARFIFAGVVNCSLRLDHSSLPLCNHDDLNLPLHHNRCHHHHHLWLLHHHYHLRLLNHHYHLPINLLSQITLHRTGPFLHGGEVGEVTMWWKWWMMMMISSTSTRKQNRCLMTLPWARTETKSCPMEGIHHDKFWRNHSIWWTIDNVSAGQH